MFFSENTRFNMINVNATNNGYDGEAGASRILFESSEEWYNLREKMMKLEHTAIVSEDAMLLEAGTGNFFTKIADFFKKIWAKLKELWNKFRTYLDKMFMSDKKFAQKYKATLADKEYKGFKMKVFPYNEKGFDTIGDGIDKLMDGASGVKFGKLSGHKSVEFSTEDEKEKIKDECIAVILGRRGDKDDFAKDVREFLRGSDEPEEEELNRNVVVECLESLLEGDKGIKVLEKAKESMEKFYNDAIKGFNDMASSIHGGSIANGEKSTNVKTFTSGSVTSDNNKLIVNKGTRETKSHTYKDEDSRTGDYRHAKNLADEMKIKSDYSTTALGILIEISKESKAQARRICAKALSHKPEKSESYNFGYSSNSRNILDRF